MELCYSMLLAWLASHRRQLEAAIAAVCQVSPDLPVCLNGLRVPYNREHLGDGDTAFRSREDRIAILGKETPLIKRSVNSRWHMLTRMRRTIQRSWRRSKQGESCLAKDNHPSLLNHEKHELHEKKIGLHVTVDSG